MWDFVKCFLEIKVDYNLLVTIHPPIYVDPDDRNVIKDEEHVVKEYVLLMLKVRLKQGWKLTLARSPEAS